MGEIARQQKRIYHIIMKTGIRPTVLDITEAEHTALISELNSARRYVIPNGGLSFEEFMSSGFELFGVRFVKGRLSAL